MLSDIMLKTHRCFKITTIHSKLPHIYNVRKNVVVCLQYFFSVNDNALSPAVLVEYVYCNVQDLLT